MNKQREIIYGQRKQVLDGMDIKQTVLNMLRSSIESQVAFAFGEHDKTDDEHRATRSRAARHVLPARAVDASSLSGLSADDLTDRFYEAAEKYYEAKEAAVTSPIMRELERVVLLRVVDEYWMDHIDAMSELRQAIRLQSYGNNKPIDVYKQESLTMFEDMDLRHSGRHGAPHLLRPRQDRGRGQGASAWPTASSPPPPATAR